MATIPDPYSLTILPALTPPPGQEPNFDHPWSIQPTIRSYVPIGMVLATMTMVVRVMTKSFIQRLWKVEDTLMVIGWVLFAISSGIVLKTLQYGAGVHQWDISIADSLYWAKWTYLMRPMVVTSGLFIKTSICLQLIRIFVKGKGSYYWICSVCTYVQVVQISLWTFLNIFQCWPVNKFWQPWVTGKCIDFRAFFTVTATITCVTDAVMLILPLVCVTKLQLQWKKKVGVFLVFAVGFIAVVASILRLIFAVRVRRSLDLVFLFTQYTLCSIAELQAGIIAGNVVCFPRFFKAVRQKFNTLGSYVNSREVALKIFKNRASQRLDESETPVRHGNPQLSEPEHTIKPIVLTPGPKLGGTHEIQVGVV